MYLHYVWQYEISLQSLVLCNAGVLGLRPLPDKFSKNSKFQHIDETTKLNNCPTFFLMLDAFGK